MKRSVIDKRLKVQEEKSKLIKFKQYEDPGVVEYHYPVGASQQEMDRLASEAKARYLAEHPNCNPHIPLLILGLAYAEPKDIN